MELAIAQAISKGGMLIGSIIVIRQVMPATAGSVFFAQNLVIFMLIFSDLGLRPIGMRNVAEKGVRDRGYTVEDSAGAILALSCILAGVIAGVAAIASSGLVRTLTIMFALTAIPYGLYPDWRLKGLFRTTTLVVAEGARGATYVLGVLLLVHSYQDAYWVPIAYGLSFAVAVVVALLTRGDEIRLPRLRWRRMFRAFKDSVSLGLAGVAVQSSYYTGTFFLRAFAGSASIAIFVSAQKLALAMYTVGVVALEVVLPRISRALARDEIGAALSSFRRFRLRLAVGSVVTAAAVAISAGPVISIIYGDAYADATSVLQLLAIAFVVYAVGVPYVALLVATARTATIMRAAWAGIAVNCILSVSLVPRMGPDGAALASIATEIAITALLIIGSGRIRDGWLRDLGPAQQPRETAVVGEAAPE